MNSRAMYWKDHFRKVHKLYETEGLAKSLDYSNNRVVFQMYAHILEGIGYPSGSQILDAGCGWGTISLLLHSCGAQVCGIDAVEETINELQKKYSFITWKAINLTDAEKLLTLPKFGHILSVEALQYVNFETVVQSLWTHLNQGGRFVACVPNSECPIIKNASRREKDRFVPISQRKILNLVKILPDVDSIFMKGLTFRDDQRFLPYIDSKWDTFLFGNPNRIIFAFIKKQSYAMYKLIPIECHYEWHSALELCCKYDTYHLHEYHLLAKQQKEGLPFLFFSEYRGYAAAFLFLLRQISDIEWLDESKKNDITSVYDYPGVVTNIHLDSECFEIFRKNFQNDLLYVLHNMNVVTLFTRQNPLFDNSSFFDGIADICQLGKTIAIYLTHQILKQEKYFREAHKRSSRKAEEIGIIVYEDKQFNHIEEFIVSYYETMKRNNALSCYFFPYHFFFNLKKLLGNRVKMFVAEKDNTVISAALFFMTDKIIQYHLSGTRTEFLKYSGLKLIINAVRIWGIDRGFHWLHLGGGCSSREDTLFHFKEGFSDKKFPFKVIKMIIDQNEYNKLNFQRNRRVEKELRYHNNDDYFPYYRAPIEAEMV